MKKIFAILAAATFMLSACNKGEETLEIKFDAPVNIKEAVSINFSSGESFMYIDLMESGNYLIKQEAVRSTSSEDGYLYGSYTYSDGVYTLSGDFEGTVSIDGDKVSIDGKECRVAEVKKASESISNEENQLCREWQIKMTSAIADVEGIKINKTWNNCDLNKISEDLAKEIEFDYNLPEGLNLISVTFSQFGKMIFRFGNGETYVAKWSFGSDWKNLMHEWLEEYMTIEVLDSTAISVSYSQSGVIIRFSAVLDGNDCAVSIGLVEKK